MTKMFEITPALVTRVIDTVDAGLSSGLGKKKPGFMCVEAAVCYAMGLPHGDDPPCVHPAIRSLKITLNDSNWSGKAARSKGMRRLAVLQLGTADCGFDSQAFAKKLALFTIRTILPIALTAAGLSDHAKTCAAAVDLPAARAAAGAAAHAADVAAYVARAAAGAAARAVTYAADTIYADVAAYVAARAAAYVAGGAASTTKKDEVLNRFATGVEEILIEMKVPAVKFLKLLD